MKAAIFLVVAIGVSLLLSACCPNGCFIVTGEAFRKAAYPKPYLEKWDKPGASFEERLSASEACGGGYTDHPGFGESRIDKELLAGESREDTYTRLFHAYERCLIAKGYRFTGECYDNEISRSSPACGAP